VRGGEIEESKGDAVGLIIDGLLSWMDRVLDSQSTFLANSIYCLGTYQIALIQKRLFKGYVLPSMFYLSKLNV